MIVRIDVEDASDAVVDVQTDALAHDLQAAGCAITNQQSISDLPIARSNELHILVAILGSAGAVQLVKTIRDYINRHKVKILITRPDGTKYSVSMHGSDLPSVSPMVKFLTDSLSIEPVHDVSSTPRELPSAEVLQVSQTSVGQPRKEKMRKKLNNGKSKEK